MSIENRRQWENARVKLVELEQLHEVKQRESPDSHVRELTLQSLKKRINQLKEEMARFEARVGKRPSTIVSVTQLVSVLPVGKN